MRAIGIAGVLALVAAAASAATVDDKIRDLEAATSSSGRLLTLQPSNIKKYLFGKQQPYHTFVLFNFVCDQCQELENEFAVMADSYGRHRARNPDATKVYFAVAQYAANQQLFANLKIRGPMLLHYAPTDGKAHSARRLPADSNFQNEPRADLIASFVKEKTGESVEIYRSPWPALITLIVLVVAGGSFFYVAHDFVFKVIELLRAQWFLWFAGAVGVYFIAVSGFLYDIIRGVPMYGYDPASRRQILFSNQSNHQYGMEGFIIGAMNVICGLSAIAVATILPKTKAVNRDVGILVAVGIFAFVYYNIVQLYRFKSPWYLRV